MVIVFEKRTIMEILMSKHTQEEVLLFLKGMNILRRHLMLGESAFVNYLITNIDGFCWECKMDDYRPALTVKFECVETDEELKFSTIKTPYSIDELSISRSLYEKIMSLEELTLEERKFVVLTLSSLISQMLDRFYSLLNTEPGVNVIDNSSIYLEDGRLAILIGGTHD